MAITQQSPRRATECLDVGLLIGDGTPDLESGLGLGEPSLRAPPRKRHQHWGSARLKGQGVYSIVRWCKWAMDHPRIRGGADLSRTSRSQLSQPHAMVAER